MTPKLQFLTAITVLITVCTVQVPYAYAHNINDLLITVVLLLGFFTVVALVIVSIIVIISDMMRKCK
jgi:hypothetical protein